MHLLIGDSHIRSYIGSSEFDYPIFLGPGKEVNFVRSRSMLSYFLRLLVLKYVVRSDWSKIQVAFVIGEPDVRYACYQDWWVDGKDIVENNNLIHARLEKSLRRIGFFLNLLKKTNILSCDLVIGAGTPNEVLSPYALKFNSLLNRICNEKNISFFDPQKTAISEGGLKGFITHSIMNSNAIDNTHFSRKISDYVIESPLRPSLEKTAFKYRSNSNTKLKYFEQFESYRIQYGILWRAIFRVLGK